MKLKYDAPLPLSAEENQKATHAAWLLGNEEGLCATSSLKIEVVDFDFVGDHDEVSSLHLNVSRTSLLLINVLIRSMVDVDIII